MSFWDTVEESTDIQSLINAANPDYDSILQNPELLRTFVAKDEKLFSFLINPTNFTKIISIMMTHSNTKISKVCVELFIAKDSPLLQKLLTEQSQSVSLFKLAEGSLNANDFVRIGYVSRIYQKAAETPTLQESLVSLFNSKLEILTFLTKSLFNTSIYDLILAYLNIQKQEDQWLIFSYLQMILPKGKSAAAPKCFIKYKDSIIGLIKSLPNFKLTNAHKINIINLMMSLFSSDKNPDVSKTISESILAIYDNEPSVEIKYLLLKLASIFPPQKQILNTSAKLIMKTESEHYGQLENAALNILSLSPSKTLISLLPSIIDKFAKDTTNNFHHMAFLKFVKQSINVPELRDEFLKKLPPLILENAVASKWRENANRVAFFLEIADVIDSDQTSSQKLGENAKWQNFRNSELLKWRKRNEGLDEAPEAVAQSKHAADAAKEDIDSFSGFQNSKLDFPEIKAETEQGKTDENPVFPEFPDVNNSKSGDQKPEFPEFPEIKATGVSNDKPEFPEFPEIGATNNTNDNKPEFPEFPEIGATNNANNEKPEFPEFPEINSANNANNDKPEFPEFPEINSANNANNDKPEFPEFPEIGAANNANDNKPAFPEFPEIGSKNADANGEKNSFASFGQIKKQQPAGGDEDGDESFEHFMELVNNPCWEYNGPTPEDLFGQKDRFTSPEDAYKFLINQT